MYFVPFIDPTEPRYAEIARIMYETGDWITPYYNYNTPFWGKPPLSFWMQAFSVKILGNNEFSLRMPSLVVTLISALLVFRATKLINTDKQDSAYLATLIFLSTPIVFVNSGAVLTDPFLMLGTTLSMVSIIHCIRNTNSFMWGYLFFIGIAIGSLSKGPISLLIIVGSLLVWLSFQRNPISFIRRLPIISGSALAILIILPWYLLAEIKTPGFLKYFIIGEHFNRYLVSGWSGDLYGSAHKRAIGMVWIFFIISTMPWMVIGLVHLRSYGMRRVVLLLKLLRTNMEFSFLIISMLLPLLIFTFSRNILWTYALPSIPPFSILIGTLFANIEINAPFVSSKNLYKYSFSMPFLGILAALWIINISPIRSEKSFTIQVNRIVNNKPVYYIGDISHSARYYFDGKAKKVLLQEIPMLLMSSGSLYVVMDNNAFNNMKTLTAYVAQPLYMSSDLRLVQLVARNPINKA